MTLGAGAPPVSEAVEGCPDVLALLGMLPPVPPIVCVFEIATGEVAPLPPGVPWLPPLAVVVLGLAPVLTAPAFAPLLTVLWVAPFGEDGELKSILTTELRKGISG